MVGPILLPEGVEHSMKLHELGRGVIRPERGIFYQAPLTGLWKKSALRVSHQPMGKVYMHNITGLPVCMIFATEHLNSVYWHIMKVPDAMSSMAALCTLMVDEVNTYYNNVGSGATSLQQPQLSLPNEGDEEAEPRKKKKKKLPKQPEQPAHSVPVEPVQPAPPAPLAPSTTAQVELVHSHLANREKPNGKAKMTTNDELHDALFGSDDEVAVAEPPSNAVNADATIEDAPDDKFAALQAQLAAVTRQKETAETALQDVKDQMSDMERRKKAYEKRKCAEVRREKEKVVEAESKLGSDGMNAVQRTAVIQQLQDRLGQKLVPPQVGVANQKSVAVNIYSIFIGQTLQQFSSAIDSKMPTPATSTVLEYEDYGAWALMEKDDDLLKALTTLTPKQTHKYTINGINYTASLEDGVLWQMNDSTSMRRKLRTTEQLFPEAKAWGYTLLFSEDSVVKMDLVVLKSMVVDVQGLDFSAAPIATYGEGYDNMLDLLARLATKWSGLCSAHNYEATNCELWIKPLMLMNFISTMTTRGVEHIRVVAHGSSDEGYNAMRDDLFGHSLKNSGKHGAIKGHGMYCGLSDMAPTSFNARSSEKAGSLILYLWATTPTIKADAGHYVCWPYMDPPDMGSVKLGKPAIGSAIVERENIYLLPLGLVRAS